MKGYTLIELIVVVGIVALLTSIGIVNVVRFQQQTNVTAVTDAFVNAVKEQQTKAMSGDAEGRGANSPYGVNIALDKYIQFHDTFTSGESSNRVITLPSITEITTTFPNSQIVFEGGSGEIVGYSGATSNVTIRNIQTNDQRVIHFNRYGAVISVN